MKDFLIPGFLLGKDINEAGEETSNGINLTKAVFFESCGRFQSEDAHVMLFGCI